MFVKGVEEYGVFCVLSCDKREIEIERGKGGRKMEGNCVWRTKWEETMIEGLKGVKVMPFIRKDDKYRREKVERKEKRGEGEDVGNFRRSNFPCLSRKK